MVVGRGERGVSRLVSSFLLSASLYAFAQCSYFSHTPVARGLMSPSPAHPYASAQASSSHTNRIVPSFRPIPSTGSISSPSSPSSHPTAAPGRRSRRWILSSVSDCAFQPGCRRNAVVAALTGPGEGRAERDELAPARLPGSRGETGDGEKSCKDGSLAGVDTMVMYRSSRSCATSASKCQFQRSCRTTRT